MFLVFDKFKLSWVITIAVCLLVIVFLAIVFVRYNSNRGNENQLRFQAIVDVAEKCIDNSNQQFCDSLVRTLILLNNRND